MNRHFCRHIGLYNLLSKISKLHAIIEYHDVAFIQTCLCVAAGYASKKGYLNLLAKAGKLNVLRKNHINILYARFLSISQLIFHIEKSRFHIDETEKSLWNLRMCYMHEATL